MSGSKVLMCFRNHLEGLIQHKLLVPAHSIYDSICLHWNWEFAFTICPEPLLWVMLLTVICKAAASASPGGCERQRISGPPQTFFPKESLSDLYAHLNLRSNGLEQAGWQTFSVKGWIVNILSCLGCRVPGTATQLCSLAQKQSQTMNGFVSIKLHFQKQAVNLVQWL